MKPIRCPKCNGSMEQVVYAEIEVDRCTQCHGIWFDSREAEQLKTIEGSEILDDGEEVVGDRYDPSAKPLSCPRCRTPLLQMLDIDQHSIWYEKCVKCHGIWLDAGEFKKFKQNFSPNKTSKSIKRLWGFTP
ncbi:zf-TFIIB domain-containing protein [Spirulina subsalsa FACHB-351]|uniref:Zf-TFIIB domain-containing protein n=2 Tax=Spirulina subsalsa TaxID=54311 RepID=A0ABT3L7G2_9CYAN|nr:zf-TFIIB domain-containing protein [Spirulina subsalsa]MCW6037439.1 zf-TFIIB domain-containing protein [Spirulina subsalsa FACHB-351]